MQTMQQKQKISSTPPILRLGHLLAFVEFLRDKGMDPSAYQRRARLPCLCEDPNLFVPLRRVWNFFDIVSRDVDRELGWHVGYFAGSRNIHLGLLRKIEHAPTLYLALKTLIQLVRSEASDIRIDICERKDDILLFTCYPKLKGAPGYQLSQSYQIGVFVDIVRHYCGKGWMPREIGIESTTLPLTAEALYPDSSILSGQSFGYIAIPRSSLHLPPPASDCGIEVDCSPTPVPELDFPETLREFLKPYLPSGYPSLALAASLLETSERTLERRLHQSKTSYREVIDNLRYSEAKKLLMDTSHPIIDVAAAVGFEDPSNFARMFRRIGGLSPRQFRRDYQGGDLCV